MNTPAYKNTAKLTDLLAGTGKYSSMPLVKRRALWNRAHEMLQCARDEKGNAYTIDLHDAHISEGVSKPADINGFMIQNADMRGVNLYHADLSGANFSGSDMTGAKLFGANMTGAVLIHTNLSYSDMRTADLREAKIGNTDFSHAQLNYADISHINVATIGHQECDGSDFTGATLENANLRGIRKQLGLPRYLGFLYAAEHGEELKAVLPYTFESR